MPYPLERFVAYGEWVQRQVAPDVDRRNVELLARAQDGFVLRLEDGETLRAERVVIAAGIAPFPRRPALADALDRRFVSHTADHQDLSRFSGCSVLVVGGGQSALESAALLHESGADVEVLVRATRINWLHGGKYHRMLGPRASLVYAPTDVGPLGLSRVVGATDLFRRLPRSVQDPIARRSIRPAGAAWLQPRLRDVPITFGRSVESLRMVAAATSGLSSTTEASASSTTSCSGPATRSTSPAIRSWTGRCSSASAASRATRSSAQDSSPPSRACTSSALPAAWSFGPTMRFVSGSWYAGRTLAREIVGAPLERGTVHRVGAG